MKTSAKTIVLCILIIFQFCVASYAQETEKPKQDLQFVLSNDQEILNIQWDKYPEISKLTHIAVIKFKEAIPFPESQLSITDAYNLQNTLQRSLPPEATISVCIPKETDKPEKSLKYILFTLRPIHRVNNLNEYTLLANSEREAREIAKTFIAICNKAASARYEDLKNEIEETKKFIVNIEKTISENKAEIDPLKEVVVKKIEEYAEANYCNKNEELIHIHAGEQIEELADFLRNVNFELAGLNAKIDSINNYKKSEAITDNETIVKLNQILITTDIERAGAIAKKQAFETAIKQAKELYDLINRRRNLTESLTLLPGTLRSKNSQLQRLEQQYENPSAQMLPVEIEDNTVIIRPVKQD